ncbi:hypothetical protein A1Q1_05142 [Trichosporon asahii var. asahii CBS 2479]|uniref:Uncharacterized protein n=1 Tax=Trichosporon asahii var. asahii (strain ATCC 90039 / CBS 2479 / JCM 2466 / KCTC 7840 / NBRC 103889/ NCYC 2677 / UAMH 7654) TaxID=1186058 RepID=J5QA99_TRIAS|nr:hypothetical protein A1Q1_05142 [Trichosporon asahii var. asahii CBS 2479]EJT46313.1 hypothetical protein A1Q1_05142 [Trichosporon asahii var. asahii CBS 2479]
MLSHALRLRPRLATSRLAAPAVAGPSTLRRPICVTASSLNDDAAPRRTAKFVTEGNRRRKALAKAAAMKSMLAAQSAPDPTPARPARKDDDAQPTVDDLLALQPEDVPSTKRPDYADKYAALTNRVDRAFMRAQLLALCQELQLPVSKSSKKKEVTAMILQSWGWPKPKAPEQSYAQEFPMSSATLFHLQRSLPLMEWLEALPGTHVSVQPAKAGGYVLTADGPRAVLDTVNRFLHDFVNTLTIEPLPTSLDMPPRVRWTVSQATGAWIDQGGITGSSSEVAAARGMLERVALQLSASSPALTLLSHDGAFALLPHVPASRRALLPCSRQRIDTGPIRPPPPPFRLLHPFTPPIKGSHPLAPGSPIADLEGTVFSPALPPALVRFPLPERTRRRRRLTYALPQGKLVVEATYPLREIQAAKKPGHEPHWTELLDQQLKGGDLFAGDASREALDRFLSEDEEEDDLVDEILGASRGDIDRLIEGGSTASAASPTFSASGSTAEEAKEDGKEAEKPREEKKMLDLSARVERNEVLTDVALPWKPVDVRFISRSTESTAVPAPLAEFFSRAAQSADYVTGLALDDVTNLRRGAAPATPAVTEAEEPAVESDTIPPPPLGKIAPEEGLTPPPTITVGKETATLVADEIMDVAESVRPHGTGPKPTLRTVSAVDLASPGLVTQYAELDGEGMWDEIGSVARAVGH